MINENWEFLTLKEAGISLIDCIHKTPNEKEKGFPYVAIPQMKDGRIDFESTRKISYEDFVLWTSKVKPEEHDMVLSRRCNPGESAYVPYGVEFALGQNLVLLRSNGSKVYKPFLRWLLNSSYWWLEVNKFLNVGAVFTSLKCADIPNFKLPIPPIPEQKKIASILSSLDDKIEINRQINITLEEMAQTLFKSWFVDFEPVKAKMKAKEKGLTQEEITISAMKVISGKTEEELEEMKVNFLDDYKELKEISELFPDEVQDSNFGEIPKGWEISNIGKEVDVVGGGTPSTKIPEFWEHGDINWTSPKDLSGLSDKVLLYTASKITNEGLKKISSGLLPVNTVLMSSRAPVGYLALAKIPIAINQGYIAMKCTRQLSPEFVIQWAESVMDEIKQRASGSTFAEISKSTFRSIPIIKPKQEIISYYSLNVKNYYDQISERLKESRYLNNTRDILISKLLSGEINISELPILEE